MSRTPLDFPDTSIVKCTKCCKPYKQRVESQEPGFRDWEEDNCPYCGYENDRSMSNVYFNYEMSEDEISNYLNKH